MKTTEKTYKMLIVEDDTDVGIGLTDFFDLKGYDVTLARDGEEAMERIRDDIYDIVLLDIMLPKKSGYDVLEESHELGLTAPVLVLTAKGQDEDVLKGFGLGAEDYVTKPFNAEELAARVTAILNRTQPPNKAPMSVHRIGGVEINFSTHEAVRDGEEISFTSLEFDILRYLIQHRGQTVTRRQLLRDVWNIEHEIVTRTVDRHIASVRKKIEPDPNEPTYIETVYGLGYRFTGSNS
ncbi:MAG: response regulator transcription factor [Rhodothermales bacterium]